jgi:hypothetical protein
MNTLGRNKTLKRAHDLSGDIIGIQPVTRKNVGFESESFLQFLDQDAGGAYKRQWHRL